MAITRITATWGGFRGAPGYSNFYFGGAAADDTDAESLAEAVRSFFNAFRVDLPSSVTISIQPSAEIIDETNGQITGQVDFTPPETITGGTNATYSAASGAVVNWNTAGYRNGRRIRGRTFVVPLSNAAYDTAGDISTASLGLLRNGAAFLTSGVSVLPFVVWARPNDGANGTAEPVVSATVPDLGAVLRSRRD